MLFLNLYLYNFCFSFLLIKRDQMLGLEDSVADFAGGPEECGAIKRNLGYWLECKQKRV